MPQNTPSYMKHEIKPVLEFTLGDKERNYTEIYCTIFSATETYLLHVILRYKLIWSVLVKLRETFKWLHDTISHHKVVILFFCLIVVMAGFHIYVYHLSLNVYTFIPIHIVMLTVFLSPPVSGRGTSWHCGDLDSSPEPIQSLL